MTWVALHCILHRYGVGTGIKGATCRYIGVNGEHVMKNSVQNEHSSLKLKGVQVILA